MTTRALAVAMLALVMASGACAPDGPDPAPLAASPAAELDRKAGEYSLYDLDLALTSPEERSLPLASLAGQVLVASMVYTTCTSVCPRIVADMKAVERQIVEAGYGEVRFVLFSLDPTRDTPQALRTFAATQGLSPERWRLFTASENGVRDLAAVLGIRYKEELNGEIAHSAVIFVIDRRGVVRHQQMGLNQDARQLLGALERARRQEAR